MTYSLRLERPPKDEEISLAMAALYAAGRPLRIDDVRSVIGTRSTRRTKVILDTIVRQHKGDNGPFEVLELEGERYVLQLRPNLFNRVKRVARPLAGRGALKTLAFIAYRQPITQKDVVAVRGRSTYKYVKTLEGLGLINRERSGRTWLLRTSEAFADLFGFSHDLRGLKTQLRSLLGEIKKEPNKRVELARPQVSV